MTTRWNNNWPVEAPGTRRPPPGLTSKIARLEDVDPWLAAAMLDDLFDRRFLWASDCGRMRFAALGESRRVDFDDLTAATREAAEDLELPGDIAKKLPLGLFVLGETDQRPIAFASGESESRAFCWTPRVLLVADNNDLVICCAEAQLRHDLISRLTRMQESRIALPLHGTRPTLLETPLDSEATWAKRVEQALTGIRRGRLEKLVVSRRLVFEPQGQLFSPWASTWQAGLASGRTGFSVSADGGKSTFIGATPETLLKIQDGAVTTHALAGTLERSATLEDFLAFNKLAKEHTIVSDGLVAKLSPLVSDVRPGPLRVRRSGSVAHLETPLAGELRPGVDPLQILSGLHPTAAIGGLPQMAAQRALRHIEPYGRGWFAAPLGWLAANGNLHAAIAIRSVWVSATRAVALAGAGIVRGSVAEEEWAETESKFDNMRAVIRGKRIGQ